MNATEATESTLPALLFERAARGPKRVAMRRKELGLWEEISWGDYAEAVRAVAAALVDAGVEAGDRVGLISENRPEWLFSDLGILSAGAVTCALYTTSAVEQLLYVSQHAGLKLVIVEDEEQLDKILELRDRHPVEKIVVIDPKGLRHLDDPTVIFWDDFVARGTQRAAELSEQIAQRMKATQPDDLAILVYTSGTTGPPKGVMLSHRNISWACGAIYGLIDVRDDYELISFLPLCHIAERNITVFNQVVNGSVVSFAENLDTVLPNMAEVRPHVFFAVPRIWEKLYNGIELRMRDASWLKRRVYAWAVEVGQRYLARRRDKPGEPVPASLALNHQIAEWTMLRHLREKLGLDRAIWALSGAAPISPEIIAYFQALGIPLVEAYGQTESAAVITMTRPDCIALGGVGEAIRDLELRIAGDGEILARGPGVMLGYYRDEEATRATIDDDGWLHTGDVGEVGANDQLRITDRKKDLIITSGGKNIAPQYIENKLRTSPYIHDAITVGDRRKFIAALIILDEDNLVDWAQRNRVPFGTYAELANRKEVWELIQHEVDVVNSTLTHVEAVKKFHLLERRLDRDEGELTPTLKVRRQAVEDKYRDIIESMYSRPS